MFGRTTFHQFWFLLAAVAVVLAACGGSDTDAEISSESSGVTSSESGESVDDDGADDDSGDDVESPDNAEEVVEGADDVVGGTGDGEAGTGSITIACQTWDLGAGVTDRSKLIVLAHEHLQPAACPPSAPSARPPRGSATPSRPLTAKPFEASGDRIAGHAHLCPSGHRSGSPSPHTCPYASIASATLTNPATFAPAT